VEKVIGFFRLTRPANIVTAISDILAGIAISGFFLSNNADYSSVVWLVLSTIGLYGGGVVMNDVFDADLDAVERPERPIPSGLILRGEAGALGLTLLVVGVFIAFLVSTLSGIIAFCTAVAAVVYNRYSKHHPVIGPLNMGLCRGLNLLLGVSIVASQVESFWYLAAVPIIYIAAITMISRGEVHGGKALTIIFAGILYLLAMGSVLYVASNHDTLFSTLAFVLLWALMVFLPLKNAASRPEGKFIGRAVKAGVLALILMNAAWAAAFGLPYLAVIIMLLLPISIMLAKVFAVT
jgi:4-hydroxybenzoate polyprenyltransferase